MWEVARYTSAAPVYFDELDDYVDGGILANNPGASGMTIIQQMYRSMDQKLPISLVVSIGGGQMPDDKLGRTDAHQFMILGKHWLDFKDTVLSRGSNLITLLGNAVRTVASHKVVMFLNVNSSQPHVLKRLLQATATKWVCSQASVASKNSSQPSMSVASKNSS